MSGAKLEVVSDSNDSSDLDSNLDFKSPDAFSNESEIFDLCWDQFYKPTLKAGFQKAGPFYGKINIKTV